MSISGAAMSKHKKKSGKGKRFRPCSLCKDIVNFVEWKEETQKRGRKIWHWANEDGSHHVHFSNKQNELTDEQQAHMDYICQTA